VTTDVEAAVAQAFRGEWGRIVATLISPTGDCDLADECAQEAFARALQRWGRDGIPRNPGAWLTTTARNRAFDQLRRSKTGTVKEQEATVLGSTDQGNEPDDSGVVDDRLRLMFTCCHPALSLDA
jgi:RNA polymerase sigma-70 factor (ECF subfamily)